MRTRAGFLAASLAAAAVLLAACGGGGGGGGASSLPTGPARALASMPDTAALRDLVVVNDLQKLWSSARVPFPPTRAEASEGAGLAASRLVMGGSQAGSDAWRFVAAHPDPLGFGAFAIRDEVAAGLQPNELSVVEGQIDASKVRSTLAGIGLHPSSSSGSVEHFAVPNSFQLASRSPALVGIHNLSVLARGDRLSVGDPKVSGGEVTDLLSAKDRSSSLASDDRVSQMLGFLKGADVMVFGTSLVHNPVSALAGANASEQEARSITDQLHLDRLPAAPRFVGYGYMPGDPSHAEAKAVAVFRNDRQANEAADAARETLQSASSPRTRERYSELFSLERVSTDGDAVVAELSDRRGGNLAEAVGAGDFPLFWEPPGQGN